MGSVEEKIKPGGLTSGSHTLLEEMKLLKQMQDQSGAKKPINSELWHACAGPLVTLPPKGSLVYYFPQGHSEQVAVSTNRTATSQIPNYPNLPSQLLCQVINVTLHADKDTDEIYAQMTLQPVNSEKDMFPIPDFGLKHNKHPSEFFCKTLTASDTSTHGGFSVPRRAAEKLFPQLDYSMQPPTQELVVRDLHDNTWTFRHIYRGQPKRHLLTTGWSMFVGTKRLRAGDAVLFIRDDKSQLLLGVRRANRQPTALPSSVLSADSMHIGVLAAAAHAAASQNPFTIFYNPRACPSEFVIPLPKFRKAVFGTQLSVGMRFGMMSETEESSKRRYMGTIVGISDLDALRWPGSKWRSLQVEWDEPGCGDKQNRVSPWEIETPESLFIFPSLTSSLKRPLQSAFMGMQTEWENLIHRPFVRIPGNFNGEFSPASISNVCSEQLIKMLIKSQTIDNVGTITPAIQDLTANGAPLQEPVMIRQRPQLTSGNTSRLSENNSQFHFDQQNSTSQNFSSQTSLPEKLNPLNDPGIQAASGTSIEVTKLDPLVAADHVVSLVGNCNEEKLAFQPTNLHSSVDELAFVNHNHGLSQLQTSPWPLIPQLDTSGLHPQHMNANQLDCASLSGSLAHADTNEWNTYSMFQSLSGFFRSPGSSSILRQQDSNLIFSEADNLALSSVGQDMWDHQMNNSSNGGSTIVDPSVSSTVLDEFCPPKDADFQNPSDCLVGNFSSSQDVQSQITSASLADSQAFSMQEFADNSGGASSSNVDFDDSSLLRNNSWQPVAPRVRTYTKIQKAGSVGRSIDVSSFKNYDELCSEIEHMFGLEGLLNNSRDSGWNLVYVDYENDVLLVGDDPWEEFVGCVKCIRILSPTEVQHMREEGMQLLNNNAIQGINGFI